MYLCVSVMSFAVFGVCSVKVMTACARVFVARQVAPLVSCACVFHLAYLTRIYLRTMSTCTLSFPTSDQA
jgi:hypothetical protein